MPLKIFTKSYRTRKLGVSLDAYRISINMSAATIFLLCFTLCTASENFDTSTRTYRLDVLEGEPFDLNCCDKSNPRYYGYHLITPNKALYQKHSGENVGPAFENEKIKYFPGSNECKIKIKKADKADKGVWNCIPYNHDGSISDTTTISHNVNIVCFADVSIVLLIMANVLLLLAIQTIVLNKLFGTPPRWRVTIGSILIGTWLMIVIDMDVSRELTNGFLWMAWNQPVFLWLFNKGNISVIETFIHLLTHIIF